MYTLKVVQISILLEVFVSIKSKFTNRENL